MKKKIELYFYKYCYHLFHDKFYHIDWTTFLQHVFLSFHREQIDLLSLLRSILLLSQKSWRQSHLCHPEYGLKNEIHSSFATDLESIEKMVEKEVEEKNFPHKQIWGRIKNIVTSVHIIVTNMKKSKRNEINSYDLFFSILFYFISSFLNDIFVDLGPIKESNEDLSHLLMNVSTLQFHKMQTWNNLK